VVFSRLGEGVRDVGLLGQVTKGNSRVSTVLIRCMCNMSGYTILRLEFIRLCYHTVLVAFLRNGDREERDIVYCKIICITVYAYGYSGWRLAFFVMSANTYPGR